MGGRERLPTRHPSAPSIPPYGIAPQVLRTGPSPNRLLRGTPRRRSPSTRCHDLHVRRSADPRVRQRERFQAAPCSRGDVSTPAGG